MMDNSIFDKNCRACPRLATFLDEVKQKYPAYHAAPVAPFGDVSPALLIVGLAPGMHGANASGRPFTGDYAGLLLYETLYEFGFSNQPDSSALDDGLVLKNCRITNAVKCLPPQNKPVGAEINQCNHFLQQEIKALPEQAVIMVLGNIAHQAVLKAYGLRLSQIAFKHNQATALPDGKLLVSSYHCSRYNIQTKRLTREMFHDVFNTIKNYI
ncbi:uracil-DNA glycosylase [methane-oxidizing endosymbiont of Gigantopelta aegis]|uniref:uracil-DNA glycosylase n=1 Tax=methane-oxidizing endosymbiont of Gigantopelta aegis TaxID=2794938 RepID=UPI0018DE3A88|nr:uracil-DNA glycosylase [methane-oxidizing endosymbiont of Gigantopelta aegis]